MRRIKHILIFSLLIIISLCDVRAAIAAAWVADKNVGQAIFTFNNYQSSHYFDGKGDEKKAGNKFNKYEISPLLEYGLTNDITIGAQPTFRYWKMKGVDSARPVTNYQECGVVSAVQNNNISGETFESEFFLRKKLLQIGNAIFSVQPLIKTPCLVMTDAETKIAWKSYEAELRTLAGYSFKWEPTLPGSTKQLFVGQYHFLDLEVAYRKRNNPFSDVVKIDGTAGLQMTNNFMLLGQFFSNISTGKENVGTIETSLNNFVTNVDNYGNLKLQLSGVLKAGKTTSVQIGAYTDVFGKNYGDGQGIILSVWKRF